MAAWQRIRRPRGESHALMPGVGGQFTLCGKQMQGPWESIEGTPTCGVCRNELRQSATKAKEAPR